MSTHPPKISRLESLRSRREALVRRSETERRTLASTLGRMDPAVDRIDRGVEALRRVARPPVLMLGGIGLALLLGRTRGRRGLTTGLSLAGLLLRDRALRTGLAGLLDRLSGYQVVRRSR